MKKSGILLEDKEIFGLDKIHRNVLRSMPDPYEMRPTRSKVATLSNDDHDDELKVDRTLLEFVLDGIEFDKQVVRSKALSAMPYSVNYVKEIFDNKATLAGNEQDEPPVRLDKHKYRAKLAEERAQVRKKSLKKPTAAASAKTETKQLAIEDHHRTANRPKFKPVQYFVEMGNQLSSSDSELNKLSQTADLNKVKSLEDVAYAGKNFFLTETQPTQVHIPPKPHPPVPHHSSVLEDESTNLIESSDEWDWDCHLINMLSENTARWIVMKRVSDPDKRQRLIAFVEKKYGRYTRDIEDLDLFEDSLTDYEKRKIKEEKERLALENKKRLEGQAKSNADANRSQEAESEHIPLYRLPQGLKRIELDKLKLPDPNFNATARDIVVNRSEAQPSTTFMEKMKQGNNLTDNSVYKTDNEYLNEILNGNASHVPTQDENKIHLENGKTFEKQVQEVFPVQFSQWISGVQLQPPDRPELKKPTKGKKKWKNMPQLIENNKINEPVDITVENYWHLMPTTLDTELRKVLKTNLTLDKIIKEWRIKWQRSSRWSQAEIDELIGDMKHADASIRFQAVVVCARAVEQKQSLKHQQKTSDHLYNEKTTDFNESLFNTIELLLGDINLKVKLAAAIAIFNMLKNFHKPLNCKYQQVTDRADFILKEALNGTKYSRVDKFAAALCVSNIGGYCDDIVLDILLLNYFNSDEQYTKEQAIRSLAHLSKYHPMVMTKIAECLHSNYSLKRILTCKLLPCMYRSLSKDVVDHLVNLMWNDSNKNVRKVAAQTLGRTGHGREVHDEVYARLSGQVMKDKIEALKAINYIGIMTNKLLEPYLKCFRDESIYVREVACRSCQHLYDKSEKIVDTLVFVLKYDRVPRLKALAIRTLGLIGDYSKDVRHSLLWAIQFELDPLIRIEACHSLVLLKGQHNNNHKDQEIIDILLDRLLVEEKPLVKKEIKDALSYMGYDTSREFPIITKLKQDVKNLNQKSHIVAKIYELERQLRHEADKQRLVWVDSTTTTTTATTTSSSLSKNDYSTNSEYFVQSVEIFEPRLKQSKATSPNNKPSRNNKIKNKNATNNNKSFLSKLVTSAKASTSSSTSSSVGKSSTSSTTTNEDDPNAYDLVRSMSDFAASSPSKDADSSSLSPKKMFFYNSPTIATTSSKLIDTIIEENDP